MLTYREDFDIITLTESSGTQGTDPCVLGERGTFAELIEKLECINALESI